MFPGQASFVGGMHLPLRCFYMFPPTQRFSVSKVWSLLPFPWSAVVWSLIGGVIVHRSSTWSGCDSSLFSSLVRSDIKINLINAASLTGCICCKLMSLKQRQSCNRMLFQQKASVTAGLWICSYALNLINHKRWLNLPQLIHLKIPA